ncbi:MAG TPA: hypothetical protein VFR90_00920 [Methylibium sp.]|uniref:hypothetical protein n=1 Tax=Methylibium sp. TaxID=2067992 RepID=UPI002DBE31B4|nr:hypothetical protein [Methylibium sp.]HEU4457667.1 hypothetical protein [Methylibium sp.]
MESSNAIIPYLFAMTLIVAIAIGIWQYLKVRKSQREHHHSADARAHGDRPMRR